MATLKEEQYQLESDRLAKLVGSMPCQVNATIKNKGNPTEYQISIRYICYFTN